MEVSAEGTNSFYPSPASRFGARDSWAATSTMDSFRHIGDDLAGQEVSPYFRGGVVAGADHDDWDAHSAEDAKSTCSPYFDRFDRRSRANGVRDPPPRRRSLGKRLAEIPIGDRLDCESDFREAESFPSEAVSCYRRKHSMTTGEIDAEMEFESLAPEGRNVRDVKRTEAGEWATEVTGALPDGGAPLSRSNFDISFGHSFTDLELCEKRRSGRASPTQAGAERNSLRRSWRKKFLGSSEEVRSGAGVDNCGVDAAAEGKGGGGNLSKLFDFAFTNKDRREVQEQPNRRSSRSRNGRTLTTEVGERVESFSSADPIAGASEAEHDVRSLSSSPRPPFTSEGSPVSASAVQALVGVTVRRPPSPQFSFMRNKAERPSPSRSPFSPSAPRPEEQDDKNSPRYCDSEARGETSDRRRITAARMSKKIVASRWRDDRSVLQAEDMSISTPPCRTKRRRPDWSETSVGKGASADIVSARSKPSPVSLPVPERFPGETLQHHRMEANQGETPVRNRRHSVGNDENWLGNGWVDWTRSGRRRRHGWWGLDVVTTPVGDVRSRGDAAAEDVCRENGSNMTDESCDLERCSAGVRDRPPGDDFDHALELGVEKTTCRTETRSGTGLKGVGLLGNDGQQPMTMHRAGLGAENMAHEDPGAEASCRITSPDPTSENLASDGGARQSPRTVVPVRAVDAALAYDRDVLGGDGLEDDTADLVGSGEGDLLDTLGLPKAGDRCGLPFYWWVVIVAIISHSEAPEKLDGFIRVWSVIPSAVIQTDNIARSQSSLFGKFQHRSHVLEGTIRLLGSYYLIP